MKITFDISKITIVKGFGPDLVMLVTDFPNSYDEAFIHAPLHMEFKATEDKAEQYVKDNFPGISVEVIERPPDTYKFGKGGIVTRRI